METEKEIQELKERIKNLEKANIDLTKYLKSKLDHLNSTLDFFKKMMGKNGK